MGVIDRDWFSDRRQPGRPGDFRPPQRRSWNPVVVALCVVALIFIGAKVDRWLTARAAVNRQPDRIRVVIPPSYEPTVRQSDALRPQDDRRAATPVDTARTITRCNVDGRVFYVEDGRCTLPQAATGGADGSYGSVPGLTPYQREMLRSADARIARDAVAARAEASVTRSVVVNNAGECPAIDEAIRALDSAARQPLSGYQQDSIRQQRQNLMSRKFALRC